MQFKFNVPNNITLIRVALIPLFATVLIADIPNRNILSAIIFSVLSISDMLDGYFARKRKQVTEFGKLIDPIADKLLICTALIMLVGKGVDLWMAIVIIAREVILTAIRIYLLPSKLIIPADNLGKSKTVVQSLAIVFILLQFPFAKELLIVSVVLTLVSGLQYLYNIRKITGNKIVNLPNLITLSRLILVIPYVFFFHQNKLEMCIFIFAVISISDKLDGISARLMNQKTELGSGLDSFTDWTLILASFVMLSVMGYVSLIWTFLMFVPGAISGTMKILHAKKARKVPVTSAAKLSVGITYITLITILVRWGFNVIKIHKILPYLMMASLICVYLSMIIYVYKILYVPLKKSKL